MATNVNRGVADGATGVSGAASRSRAVMLLGLAVLAAFMLRGSLAVIVRPLDPALALRIDPGNSDVEASRAEQVLREDSSPANRAFAEHLSRLALQRSPVDAAAARMLATTRDLAGDAAAARRLMAYSESLSRRDLPAQLWFIEDAVRRSDIPEALRHYDIALRGSVTTAPLLFPVLVAATAQPPVVDGLIDTLAARPLWADPFLAQVSQSGQDYDGLARLLTGLARRGYVLPAGAVANATTRMVDAGRYDTAWQVYSAARHDTDRSRVRDPEFVRVGDGGTPFDWAITRGNGLDAEPGNRLVYSADTGAGGVIARQLLLLPVGEFMVTGQTFGVLPEDLPPRLRLTCAGSGRLIGTLSTLDGGKGFSGRFAVPSDCPGQWLEVTLDGGDSASGASGELAGLRIRPVRR